MEYMPNGSLYDYIDKENYALCPHDYNQTKKQMILAGISKGMEFLHSNLVFHRDLKPGNILLDQELKPRITDFGLSKFIDLKSPFYQSIKGLGTIPYMAPEVLQCNDYGFKADVYSFGILMYEVVTSDFAYSKLLKQKNFGPPQLVNFVLEGGRPTFENPVKKGLEKLIKECWSQDPDKRPTFSQIYQKLSLYKEDEKDDDKMQYCIDEIDYDEFMDYIDYLNNYPYSINNNSEFQKRAALIEESYQIEINSMKSEINYPKEKHKIEMSNSVDIDDMSNSHPKNELTNSLQGSLINDIYKCIKGTIIKANGIPFFDLANPNTFATITVTKKNAQCDIVQTDIRYKTHDPLWNKDFEFLKVKNEYTLKVEVFHVSKTIKKQCIASVMIPFNEIKEEDNDEKEYVLEKPINVRNVESEMNFGTITLRLYCSVMSNVTKE